MKVAQTDVAHRRCCNVHDTQVLVLYLRTGAERRLRPIMKLHSTAVTIQTAVSADLRETTEMCGIGSIAVRKTDGHQS